MIMKVHDSMNIYEVEEEYEWRKWIKEIPTLDLSKLVEGAKVAPLPCYGGAVARMKITRGDCYVSVYLDCYDKLGYVGQPYWEVYPVGYDVERCLMGETDELIKLINQSLIEQEVSK
jgi:hypothetical protein